MENNKSLNSFLYDLYKLKKQYGSLIDDMEKVQKSFDKFYDLLSKEQFDECGTVLEEIVNIVGENNSDVIRAKTMLAFERD